MDDSEVGGNGGALAGLRARFNSISMSTCSRVIGPPVAPWGDMVSVRIGRVGIVRAPVPTDPGVETLGVGAP